MQTQNPTNPLEQLQDIHVPDGVDAWPLAWGWWIVIGLTITALVAISIWLYKRHRFLRAKREAIREVNALQSSHPDWAQQQNAILKRTASYYYDSHTVASLYGQRWQQFLLNCLSNKKNQSRLSKGMEQLQQVLYQPQPLQPDQFEACQKACLHWLKHARFSRQPPETKVGGSNA